MPDGLRNASAGDTPRADRIIRAARRSSFRKGGPGAVARHAGSRGRPRSSANPTRRVVHGWPPLDGWCLRLFFARSGRPAFSFAFSFWRPDDRQPNVSRAARRAATRCRNCKESEPRFDGPTARARQRNFAGPSRLSQGSGARQSGSRVPYRPQTRRSGASLASPSVACQQATNVNASRLPVKNCRRI